MKCKVPATVLRAGIIIGSGSASFEIIRDLEKTTGNGGSEMASY
jgi:hypothetical protein